MIVVSFKNAFNPLHEGGSEVTLSRRSANCHWSVGPLVNDTFSGKVVTGPQDDRRFFPSPDS